jgi:hypothetical protein
VLKTDGEPGGAAACHAGAPNPASLPDEDRGIPSGGAEVEESGAPTPPLCPAAAAPGNVGGADEVDDRVGDAIGVNGDAEPAPTDATDAVGRSGAKTWGGCACTCAGIGAGTCSCIGTGGASGASTCCGCAADA